MPLIQTDIQGVEYHKIDTLFERDENFVVDTGKLKQPVLGTISQWDVTEKIDGTNTMRNPLSRWRSIVRVVVFAMPRSRLIFCKCLPVNSQQTRCGKRFRPKDRPITLCEGYGAGIQKGDATDPTSLSSYSTFYAEESGG